MPISPRKSVAHATGMSKTPECADGVQDNKSAWAQRDCGSNKMRCTLTLS